MKIAACITYIIVLFLYFLLDLGSWWGSVYLILQAVAIAFFIEQNKYEHTSTERQFFSYVKYVAIADAIYTFICEIHGGSYIYHATNVFAYIMALGMCVIVVHFAVKKDKI